MSLKLKLNHVVVVGGGGGVIVCKSLIETWGFQKLKKTHNFVIIFEKYSNIWIFKDILDHGFVVNA